MYFVYFVVHQFGFRPPMDLAPYRAFIAELAAESGDFIRPFFGRADLAV